MFSPFGEAMFTFVPIFIGGVAIIIFGGIIFIAVIEASHFLNGTSSYRTLVDYTEEMIKRNA